MKLPDQQPLIFFLVGVLLAAGFFLFLYGPSVTLLLVLGAVTLIASIALALSILSAVE